MAEIIQFSQSQLEGTKSETNENDIYLTILNISSSLLWSQNEIKFRHSGVCNSSDKRIIHHIEYRYKRLNSLNFQLFFKISQKKIVVELQMSQSSSYYEIIRSLASKHQQKFIAFTSYVNNLYFGSDSKGQFFYRQNQLHKLRQCIFKSSLLKCHKISQFIKKQILQLSKKFAQFIENILDYFEIPIAQKNVNQQKQEVTQSIYKIKKNLFLLRLMFVKNYGIRTNINLEQLNLNQFLLNNGFSKLYNLPTYDLQGLLQQFKINKSSLFQIAKNSIQQFYQIISEERNQYQRLLSPVRINGIKKLDQNFMKGGSSMISKGLYSFSQQLSCNNIDKTFQKKIEIIHRQKYLCKKRMISDTNGVLASFQNQIIFLYQKRNSRCKQVASYYFDVSKNKNLLQQKAVYLDYYSHTLNEIMYSLNIKQKIKITHEMLKVLFYFKEQEILHRDLKQENILMDIQNNIKVIDFGSICKVYNPNKPEQNSDYHNKLRFTQNYSISFSDLKKNYPQLARLTTLKQFQQHSSFDFFAFGEIIKNMFGFYVIHEDIFDVLSLQLRYICCKCREIMPNRRLTLQEMILYIRQLLEWIQTKFP